MTRSNKYLPLTIIFSTAIALTGCLANQNNKNSPSNTGYNSYNSSSSVPQVNIDDLRNGSDANARQQLYARGFNEVGNNLWSNSRTNQCYQLISINGKVGTIMSKHAEECGLTSAPNTGYNNNQNYNQNQNQNPNYNQNQGYNNATQPVPGQTPAALNDFVGSRAGQAEGDLVRRGYVLRKSAGLNSYWEETATGGCVSIVTNDGRYQSLVYVVPSACR
jgi:hypothetical protein